MDKNAGLSPELASNSASRAGAAQPWMNSSRNSASGGGLRVAGKAGGGGGEPQVTQSASLGGQGTAPATIVRFQVSRQALESKVFEKLLARAVLDSEPSSATGNGSAVLKTAENVQSPAAAANLQYSMASKAPAENRDGQFDKDASSQPAPQQIVMACDASQEQLASIVEQVRKNSESFSIPEVLAEGVVPPAQQQLAENYAYGTIDRPSPGRRQAEKAADRPVEQERSKAEADQSNSLRQQAVMQSPAAHAPVASGRRQAVPRNGAARQHVVFVLSVVDRISPAVPPAAPASHTPAAPAKKP
jgi:hypothetical protein